MGKNDRDEATEGLRMNASKAERRLMHEVLRAAPLSELAVEAVVTGVPLLEVLSGGSRSDVAWVEDGISRHTPACQGELSPLVHSNPT